MSNDEIPNAAILPDGSAFAVLSMPLPKDHWLYAERTYSKPDQTEPDELPAPILTHAMRETVVAAIRYAVRGATMCGREEDFDPDALVQNAVYALCGPYGGVVEAAQPDDPDTPHAVFEWAGEQFDKVMWGKSGLRPAVLDITKRALARMEIAASATASQERDDTGRLTSDYEPTPHEIEVARQAIRREFGNNGTDGYYVRILKAVHGAAPQAKFECAARKQGSVGGNDPAECDWPLCGCDTKATEVIAALQECDLLKDRPGKRTPIYQIGANAGGGIAWWDVDKDRYEREKRAGYMKTGIVYREGK